MIDYENPANSDKPEVIKLLRENKVQVVFTKKGDGEERTMNCTLISTYLPELTVEQKDRAGSKSPQEETLSLIIAVWDLDKNGWRSFDLRDVKPNGLKVLDA